MNLEFCQRRIVMKIIKNITLVAVATTEVEATVHALEYSIREIEFEKVLLIASHNPRAGESTFYDYVQIPPFKSVGDWGKFVVFDLYKYINTEFILLVHADGFVVNPHKWSDQFFDYDYIGAPWPLPKDDISYRDYYGNIIRVGNSVSLRSKKLLQMPSEIGLKWENFDHGFPHEDGYLCVQHRHTLQEHGIQYAPLQIASAFSREKTMPENQFIDPFVFHKWEGRNKNYPCFGRKPRLSDKITNKLKKLFKGIRNE